MIDPLASYTFLPLQLSRNVIEHVIEAADTVSVPDRSELQYFLRIDVPEFPHSSMLVELTTMEGREKPPVTIAGATTYEGAFFSIEELLDGFLSVQKPSFGQTGMTTIATLTMPYQLCERIEPGTSVKNCPLKWVMKAGLTDVDFAGWGDRFFDTYQQQARKFLTWQPDGKLVNALQPELLYFLLNISPMPSTVRLRCEYTRMDGEVQEITLLELQNGQPYQVLCVPVGPEQLRLALNTSLVEIISYKVWLANAENERISEVRTYQIDGRYRRNERYVIFNNSLGGFDTLRLTGSASELLHVERASAERERPAGAGADFSELYVIENLGERTLTVSTGYVERSAASTLRYWDELLLAKEWYLVTQTGHVALELLTTDLPDVDDESDLVARTFAFRMVAAETNFSTLPPPPSTPTRPTGWRGYGFRQLLDAYGKRTGFGAPQRLRKYYLDDSTDVKPILEKPNLPGASDYINPTPVPGVLPGTTPYPNDPINRMGTRKRGTCGSGQEGGSAIISVPAGKYGGERANDANTLAEIEFSQTDTQEFADLYGSCTLSENYTWSIPAGQWHMRFSHPTQLAIFHNDGIGGPADMGNIQALQGQTGTFIYPAQSNDLNFPVGDANWLIYAFGTAGAAKKLTIYRNGAALETRLLSLNRDGFELLSFVPSGAPAPATGDRWYLKYEDQ